MAPHLREFDWEPIVLTVNPHYYEEQRDDAALSLLPDSLRIEQVNAWSASICRPLGFGDISLRAQWTMRRCIAELVRCEKIDLIFATVLPGYTSLVGAWAKRKFRIPFVLDYQDPWVSDLSATRSVFGKRGLAHWLAIQLEPSAVAAADALTAVSDETLRTLRARSLIRRGQPIEIIPIGADPNDHEIAAKKGHSLIKKRSTEFALLYMGTITTRMLPAVKTLFRALKLIIDSQATTRFTLYFIGTSGQTEGKDTLGLTTLARDLGVLDYFYLQSRRMDYLDALRSMHDADALLLLGSTDSHYTASKIFPYWSANKPILALFHVRSNVNEIAREIGGIRVISYDDATGPLTKAQELAGAVVEVVNSGMKNLPVRNQTRFERYSARGIAARYASLFDRVMITKNRVPTFSA